MWRIGLRFSSSYKRRRSWQSCGACFDQVAEFAEALKWRDAMEISGAQMNLLDRLLDGTLTTADEHFEVFDDAKKLLFGLKLPVIEAVHESQIDDRQYERVIERADVLASGGEFVLDDEASDDSEDALVQVQLATVLDMLPSLLEAYRGQIEEGSVQHELDADLQAVAEATERLRLKLT